MSSEKDDSPGGSVTGALGTMLFGAVFMTVGCLMFWGLTRDLEKRWDKSLAEDGYGTPAEVAKGQADFAAFPGLLAGWKTREAQRLETAKAKLTPEAEEGALEKEVDALREAADDWEPQRASIAIMPLPEGLWARFVGLSTNSRVDLFKGVMVAPVPFMAGLFIALGGLVSLIGERGARSVMRQLPDRPWLHVSEWSALQGRSSASANRAGIVMMLCVFGWPTLCASLMWILERFEVPDDQPTTQPGYRWIVEVSAETPGTDFEESFEVPVYRAAEPKLRSDWDVG